MGILRTDRITGLGGANAIKGSVFFGTNDSNTADTNLAITNASDLDIGAGNYTIEYWFNCDDTETGSFNTSVALSEYTNLSANNAFNIYHQSKGFNVYNRSGGAFAQLANPTDKWIPSRWHHFAWVRSGTGTNENAIYVDGVSVVTFTNALNYTSGQHWLIGANFYTGSAGYGNNPEYGFSGHLSNVRISNIARYSGAFTPPTAEFSVDSNTILLACQSPSNILQEATGKEVTYYGGSLKSVPPQASKFTPNSPVGFSTTTDVGSQYGTTFDGFGSFATSTYMVPPGGNTRERGRGRALFAGGYVTPNTITAIDSIEIQSGGLTKQFGDLSTTQHANCSACSSSTRMVTNGGWTGSANSNVMEFVTIANESNSTDFGDLGVGRRNNIAASNQTRGLVYGGNGSPSGNPRVDFFTIATLGDAADFGDASAASAILPAGGSSTTRALFAGGYTPSASDTIDYYTIASTGNATDFGNLVSARKAPGGLSSSTRTLFGGGGVPSAVNSIDFVTTATTGNATDFGDLFLARSIANGTSNQTRGIFMGGSTSPARQDTIDSVTIASIGNAVNWGDFTTAKQNGGVASDSHGGLS